MEGFFPVTIEGQAVGTVKICREGLYYHLFCCCRMEDSGIHRLYADGEKIGVLIPERGELVLETRVAVKRLKKDCAFSLDGKRELFVPIRPGEEFQHLEKVRESILAFRNGVPGIVPNHNS